MDHFKNLNLIFFILLSLQTRQIDSQLNFGEPGPPPDANTATIISEENVGPGVLNEGPVAIGGRQPTSSRSPVLPQSPPVKGATGPKISRPKLPPPPKAGPLPRERMSPAQPQPLPRAPKSPPRPRPMPPRDPKAIPRTIPAPRGQKYVPPNQSKPIPIPRQELPAVPEEKSAIPSSPLKLPGRGPGPGIPKAIGGPPRIPEQLPNYGPEQFGNGFHDDYHGHGFPMFSEGACHLRADPGHCNLMIGRWYFDNRYHRCLPFLYTGCGGNNNNFLSFNQCEAATKRCDIGSYPHFQHPLLQHAVRSPYNFINPLSSLSPNYVLAG